MSIASYEPAVAGTEELLRKADVLRMCKIGNSTLTKLLKQRAFPQPIVLGESLRWRRADLESYLRSL